MVCRELEIHKDTLTGSYGQLVTLLQMLEKYGLVFYKIGELLQRLDVSAFVGKGSEERQNDYTALGEKTASRFRKQDDEHRANMQERLRLIIADLKQNYFPSLRGWCEEVNLSYSLKSLNRAEAAIDAAPTFGTIERIVGELTGRIEDELDSVWFIHVPDQDGAFYNNPSLFGDTVALQFGSAAFDIEHAGDCLALGQFTAAVMHLMRALEVATDALGRGLGLPDVVVTAKHSWTKALKDIFDQIGVFNKSGDPNWTTDKAAFFEEARLYLFGVKRCWRDTSMHLDKKYERDEAVRIFTAVKHFMEYLAQHLNESGTYTS